MAHEEMDKTAWRSQKYVRERNIGIKRYSRFMRSKIAFSA